MFIRRIFKAMDEYRITGFPTIPKGVELILSQHTEMFKLKKWGKFIKTCKQEFNRKNLFIGFNNFLEEINDARS